MTSPVAQPVVKKSMLSNRMYGLVKFIAMVALPAAGALYFGLATIWSLPRAEEVVGTITVVDTFLGVLLGISTKSYNNSDIKYDGDIEIGSSENGDSKIYTLALNSNPEDMESKSQIVFKVKTSESS